MTNQQAMELYVSRYGGSFKLLSPTDVDYRLYDNEGNITGYVSILKLDSNVTKSFPVTVAAKEVVKLCEKRMDPIIMWSCRDGIIYGHANMMKGTVQWLPSPLGIHELMITYKRQDHIKYLKW